MASIFISSTYLDLQEIRASLCTWLATVFGANLVVMETFGSDTDPPSIVSVRRVRECDIFIGLYGTRYGTIDPESGKSITELELDEAERAHSTGTIHDILLYTSSSTLALEGSDSDPGRVAKLAALRERALQHTCSTFGSLDDLLLKVLGDVFLRLSQTSAPVSLSLRTSRPPKEERLRRPIGMEFLASRHQRHLVGRAAKIIELSERVRESQVSLIIGDSGCGKTSLLHAGLIPHLLSIGWRSIYTRPFGLPSADIVHQIQSDVFTGRAVYRGGLIPLLTQIRSILPDEGLLLIIDQFEDVLAARANVEVDRLIADLRTIRQSSSLRTHPQGL